MAVITTRQLSRAFGATEVLKGVDLAIADGSLFTRLGPLRIGVR